MTSRRAINSGGGDTDDGDNNDKVAQLGLKKGEERRAGQQVAPLPEVVHQQGG